MITPRVFQLEHIAARVTSPGTREILKGDDLKGVEIAMRPGDPLDTGLCSPKDLSFACLSGAATILRSNLLGDGSARFATLVTFWTITRNGYRYIGNPDELRDILQHVASVSQAPLYEPDEASAKALVSLIQFQPPTSATWAGRGIRAYVISPLTGAGKDAALHQTILTTSDAVAFLLEEHGIWTHLPARYTNPNIDSTTPPPEVRRLDHGLVINADLCVFIAMAPTTGGGEELAWADGASTPVIMITEEERNVSKLVRGTTGKLTIIHPSDIESSLTGALLDLRPDITARNNVRNHHTRIYGPLIDELRDQLRGSGDLASPILTQRRVEELTSSPEHLAQAPLWQLQEVTRLAGIRYGPMKPLDSVERGALVEFAEGAGLSLDETLELAQQGQTLIGATERYRSADGQQGLNDAEAWRRLHRGG